MGRVNGEPARRRARGTRPWAAIVAGVVVGFIAALAGTAVWGLLRQGTGEEYAEGVAPQAMVDLFRLPSGTDHELLVIPAGPDGIGEPQLTDRLFPEEDPPRQLASLLVANVSPTNPWEVDLQSVPLRCRTAQDSAWESFEHLQERIAARHVAPAQELRLRSLGAGVTRFSLGPRTSRRILVALPPGRTLEDLAVVQWGETALLRDRLELERVRRFREDPGGVTTGR